MRTALLAWLQVRLQGGTFIMRMEDLDRPRCIDGMAERILEDLVWVGLDWDEGCGRPGAFGPYLQSQRDEFYRAALRELDVSGHLFACACSRRDIRMASSAPHGRSPVYPGTCREAALPVSNGHSLRMRVPDRDYCFQDGVLGPFCQNLALEVGDFVVRRKDGLFAYQLAVVVDDAMMGISHVVRGEDLVDSTPRQLLLFEALGVRHPEYWHVPIMKDETGQRMAKRFGSTTVGEFREQGGSAAQLIGMLAASVGLIPDGAELSAGELLAELDYGNFTRRLRSDRPHGQPVLGQ